MASVTLSRRAHKLQFIRGHRNNQSYNSDDEETNSVIDKNYRYFHTSSKPIKASSCDQPEIQSSLTTTSNNPLRHIYSRLKRRFTLTKEHRTRSEDTNESVSERRSIRFGNYKSFSSSIDHSSNEFEWPDFEKVYDSIPPCLINALPGLDDFSIEQDYDCSLDILNYQTDQCPTEQANLFLKCKRVKYFRRNAICPKIDKSQHHGQLDVFIQQLMIEKLMRTWT